MGTLGAGNHYAEIQARAGGRVIGRHSLALARSVSSSTRVVCLAARRCRAASALWESPPCVPSAGRALTCAAARPPLRAAPPPGCGRGVRQGRGGDDGDRQGRADRHHDSLGVKGAWPPGGDGCAHGDGAGDGAGRDQHERQAARVRADQLAGGAGLPGTRAIEPLSQSFVKRERLLMPCRQSQTGGSLSLASSSPLPPGGDGVRRKLRLGEPQLDDLPLPTGAGARRRPPPADLVCGRCVLAGSPASPGPTRPLRPRPLQAFAKMFNSTPDDLDMHVVYDVSHNIAKVRKADGRFSSHFTAAVSGLAPSLFVAPVLRSGRRN